MTLLRQLIADLRDEPARVARRIRTEIRNTRREELMDMLYEGYSAADIARYAIGRENSFVWKVQEIRLSVADLLDQRKGGAR